MNFGPLSAEGGERRLNVLITRARERCEVFSSMRSQDVDLARARGAGPKALKLFLHFAQLGVLDVAEPSERDYGSPFEEQVGRALERHGLNVVPQVGIAGFFVDLAIVDPENPGDYLLGIECDGASYHSARSARDRDRLREAVLRDRGWLLHRIWSTDWFHQPDVELRKALAAIEQARAMRSSSDHHSSEDVLDDAEESRDNTETDHIPPARAVHLSTPRSRARRYKQADVRAPAGLDFHQASLAKLAEIASEIVEAEGPVHGDEVARRLAAAFGLKRAGGKIQEKSKRALDNLMRRDVIARDGKFFHRSGQRTFPPRSREHVSSPTLRRPERLPPVEIRAAIAQVVSDHLGVSYDDAAIQVARMLGFKRTGGELRVVIRKQIKTMVGKDELRSEGGKLYK
jgi:very-short-patch-repair endonuclease